MKAVTAKPSPAHEHEFEAAYGLPETLPAGEHLLWQGSPDLASIARRALHVRKLALYFAAMLAWRGATVLADGGGVLTALWSVAWFMPLVVLCLGMLGLMAWLVTRTTVYTVTNKRVVMRIGIVLTITFNLPLQRIEAAALRMHGEGTGDIVLTLAGPDRIAYAHLWPHARPWQLRRPQPMLRSLPDAARVAQLLADALAASAGTTAAAVNQRPVDETVAPANRGHGHAQPIGA